MQKVVVSAYWFPLNLYKPSKLSDIPLWEGEGMEEEIYKGVLPQAFAPPPKFLPVGFLTLRVTLGSRYTFQM